jgi:hypothetical protein
MSGYARIGSVDVLREFRASLCSFAHSAATALEESYSEIQRTNMWLKQQQHSHWKNQLRLATEQYQKAKLALKSKQNYDTSRLGAKYSYIDEKKALALAQRKMELAQQKLVNVQRWINRFEKESFDYKGLIQGLLDFAELEIPNAVTQIDRMIDSLESYIALAPPPASPEMTQQAAAAESVQRPEAPTTSSRVDHASLRKKVPSQQLRDQIQCSEEPPPWLTNKKIRDTYRKKITDLNIETVPVNADDKILIAATESLPERIYLVRNASDRQGDSGWFIGLVDQKSTDYQAVRSSDLLKTCPDFSKIFELPVGFIVVLINDRIETIVDPDGKIVYAAE